MKFPTGGTVRKRKQIRCNSETDGTVRMKEENVKSLPPPNLRGIFLEETMNHKPKSNLKYLAVVGMLCALAFVAVMVFRIPVVLFLKYEPKDVIITLGGLIYGPFTSALISAVVSLLEMVTISDTGLWGLVMNFLSSCSFACTAALIYKKKKTLWGAVLGLLIGCVVTVGVMMMWNYLITPIYMEQPREKVAAMLLPAFLPFNLLKTALNAAFTFLLYRPVITALRKGGFLAAPSLEQKKKFPLGFVLAATLVIVTCVLVILVFNNII